VSSCRQFTFCLSHSLLFSYPYVILFPYEDQVFFLLLENFHILFDLTSGRRGTLPAMDKDLISHDSYDLYLASAFFLLKSLAFFGKNCCVWKNIGGVLKPLSSVRGLERGKDNRCCQSERRGGENHHSSQSVLLSGWG
jgi:hypothetical protein